MERPCATMQSIPTWRRGSIAGRGSPPSCTRSRCTSTTYIPVNGATSNMKLTLHIWRQRHANEKGRMVRYEVPDVNPEMSFLEMLDVLNEHLIDKGQEPVAFDHDCREGICGMCGFMIDGVAHGPRRGTTVCQLHMRSFHDGDSLTLEPWRAAAFPVIKDLVVDRSAFDRIIQSGGFISAPTGAAPEAHSTPVPKPD